MCLVFIKHARHDTGMKLTFNIQHPENLQANPKLRTSAKQEKKKSNMSFKSKQKENCNPSVSKLKSKLTTNPSNKGRRTIHVFQFSHQ